MNLGTNVMKYMTEILRNVDKVYKEFATEPYGQRQLTEGEQMQFYQNLTESQLYEMVEKHGIDEVSEWLFRMEQRSNNA